MDALTKNSYKVLSENLVRAHETNERLVLILVSVVGTMPREMRAELMPELAEIKARSTETIDTVRKWVSLVDDLPSTVQ